MELTGGTQTSSVRTSSCSRTDVLTAVSPDGSFICSRSVLQIPGLRLVSSTCSSVSAHKAAVAVMERSLVLCQQLPLNWFFLRAAHRRFSIQKVNRPYRISGGCRSSSHKTEPAINSVSGRHQTSVTCTCSVCYCSLVYVHTAAHCL